MEVFGLLAVLVCSAWGYAPLREPGLGGSYSDSALIQELMERMNRDMEPAESGTFLDFPGNKFGQASGISFVPGRSTKDSEFFDENENDYDFLGGSVSVGHPSIRDQEYLQHSTLLGQGQGGLTVKGQKVPSVKPDAQSVLPAYCAPANPCPVGYSGEDGCLEIFENTAAFSRAYQASQDCMCDTEHMFDCHSSNEGQDDEQEEGQEFLQSLQMDGQHKNLVAKKFYNKKAPEETLSRLNEMARNAAAAAHHEQGVNLDENPFLQGEKLPIAAKKGHHA